MKTCGFPCPAKIFYASHAKTSNSRVHPLKLIAQLLVSGAVHLNTLSHVLTRTFSMDVSGLNHCEKIIICKFVVRGVHAGQSLVLPHCLFYNNVYRR